MTNKISVTAQNRVQLREVREADLPTFFTQQLEPDATLMAAFPAREKETFMAHWAKIMADETVVLRTILFDGRVAGNIVSFVMEAEREVGYWLGKEFWGQGIATQALTAFLAEVKTRPLYAHVVKDNFGSLRVLQKCGFVVTGADRWFSSVRAAEVDELVLKLEADH